MAIEGPLRELGIHDVFQLLDLNRKTGVLRLTSDLRHNQGAVWFNRGTVVYAEIRSNPHRIGDLLVRAGKITEADLQRAHGTQQEEGGTRRIGEILVDIGAITRSELDRQVRFQVEEVIFEMMSWQEGYFSFSEEPVDVVPGDAVTRIRIETLLMEGARRIDEWSRMERKIPHVGVVPKLAPVADGEEGQLDLLPTEWEVLAMVDGDRDIRGIAGGLGRSDFDVARTIFGLESAGILSVVAPGASAVAEREAPAQSVETFLAEAEGALAKSDTDGARAIVESGLGTHPHDGRLYVLLGQVHLLSDRPAEAEENFRRGLRLDSMLAPAHRLLGDALAQQGRLREATAWWTRWLSLHQQGSDRQGPAEDVQDAIRAAQVLDRYLRETP